MIEIKNLKTGYDGKIVLEIESLNFKEGEVTAVVGLNGSGKSTLLKSLVGITSYQGSIKIDEKKASGLSHKKKAAFISYLPQTLPVANLDIYTLVCHGRFPYLGYSKILGKQDIEEVEKALRLTDLWHLRDKKLSEVSGGERQRAYLAMVIAQNTKYILLDEPATYMDIKHQLEIMVILRKLAEQGRAVIFSSHDLPQSFSVSDKVCLLKGGRLVAEGRPENLTADSLQIKNVMGVSLGKAEDKDSIYGYILKA